MKYVRNPFISLSLLLSLLVCAATLPTTGQAEELPAGFVSLADVAPDILQEIRYYGEHNFVGAPVDGYLAPKAILTRPAAEALARAQEQLKPFGLGLKVFDAYRPQRAVDHFVRWAKDLQDTKTKAEFYPEVPKDELFERGYIASRSSHSRGSTVDLTLVSVPDGAELDMGSGFDFFSPMSWPTSQAVGAAQRAHRLLLRRVMLENGFAPYEKEWWHFTFKNEPYPQKRFDFPVQ